MTAPRDLADPSFLAAFASLPIGTFHGTSNGRRYIVSKQSVAGGKGAKLIAEALDGSDYISLNLYHLQSGDILKPCEMPQEKVITFVLDLRPLADGNSTR